MSSPQPLERPALARWLWERNISFAAAAARLGRSHEHIRQLCLPFKDAKRKTPDAETLGRIVDWTEGEIGEADFHPPKTAVNAASAVEARP